MDKFSFRVCNQHSNPFEKAPSITNLRVRSLSTIWNRQMQPSSRPLRRPSPNTSHAFENSRAKLRHPRLHRWCLDKPRPLSLLPPGTPSLHDLPWFRLIRRPNRNLPCLPSHPHQRLTSMRSSKTHMLVPSPPGRTPPSPSSVRQPQEMPLHPTVATPWCEVRPSIRNSLCQWWTERLPGLDDAAPVGLWPELALQKMITLHNRVAFHRPFHLLPSSSTLPSCSATTVPAV